MYRLASLARNVAAVLLIGMLALIAGRADAVVLEGTVKGQAGSAKSFVRVEIFGPDTRKAFTDAGGKFSVDVREGEYTVQITERDRVVTFPVSVRGGGVKQTFALPWR